MILLFSPLCSEDPLCIPSFYLHTCTSKEIVFISSAKCETRGSLEYQEGKACGFGISQLEIQVGNKSFSIVGVVS